MAVIVLAVLFALTLPVALFFVVQLAAEIDPRESSALWIGFLCYVVGVPLGLVIWVKSRSR